MKSITIGNNVESLGYQTFSGCSSLESIVIPDRVSSIDDYSFYECSSLKSITIGNNVKTIGTYAFSGCNSIESIVIPDSVTSIKKGAFADCTSLNKVSFGERVKKIEEIAFRNASIKECYSYNPTPPSILYTEPGWSSTPPDEYCTFYHAITEGAVLYVPKGSRDKYGQSRWNDYFYYYDEWNNKYSNVREME